MVCEKLGLEPVRRPGKKNGGGDNGGGVVGGTIGWAEVVGAMVAPLEELCWRKRGRKNWRAENVSGEVAIVAVWAKGIVVPRALMQGVMGLPRTTATALPMMVRRSPCTTLRRQRSLLLLGRVVALSHPRAW